jgi:hypothetical protein
MCDSPERAEAIRFSDSSRVIAMPMGVRLSMQQITNYHTRLSARVLSRHIWTFP